MRAQVWAIDRHHERETIDLTLCRITFRRIRDDGVDRTTLYKTEQQTAGATRFVWIILNDLDGSLRQASPDRINIDPIRKRFTRRVATRE